MSEHELSKDIFEYDKTVLEAIKQRHDTMLSFALQNYTACGAVAFFYFNSNNRLPLWVAFIMVLLLNGNFVLGIAANYFAARKLYVVHRIATDCWMRGKNRSSLHEELLANSDSAAIVTSKEFPLGWDFSHASIKSNMIPSFIVLVLIITSAIGWL